MNCLSASGDSFQACTFGMMVCSHNIIQKLQIKSELTFEDDSSKVWNLRLENKATIN